MRIYTYAIFTSLIIASGSFAAYASPQKEVKEPGFTINADKLEQVTDDHTKASGNVSIKVDNTEIKSDKMDIRIYPDKIELTDGKFKATVAK
ncbi:hypothetical protein HGG72_16050 [Ochrobactrum pecoris]|uniref:Lipopolysaccharide export system protein LptA n=1 Tax=Brucella pecoris TaxID=867683 RepID=A0A5C5CKG9_9HYPH|nr:LptA/OstA family protein [Brucella pecoris]MBB4094343.1 lipopolysaccharide export system protein LptA [Brucella pecoris]NKW81482.1 hypothetical protein [Brucella pecoris]TNV12009.1 hypothetical protein FIB18_11220 [Brucella pecoris]